MRLRSHDEGFVAAPPPAVYATVRDLGRYGTWWTGAGPLADDAVHLPLGRRKVPARPERPRPDVGLHLALPSFDGSLEWYLEPFDDGTIVHAFLDVDVPGGERRATRRLLRLRGSLRRALVGLKRSVEDG